MILIFVEKSQIFRFEIWKCFWNFLRGATVPTLVNSNLITQFQFLVKLDFFLVKNEQSRKVRNHNVLLETKLDNDQKNF